MRKIWITGLSTTLLVCGLALILPTKIYAGEIPDGIYVGDRNLGGMTKEEAEGTVQEYIDSLAGQKITLKVDGTPVETTAEALGFHWTNTDVVEQAVGDLLGGNLIRRYMNRKDLEKEPVKVDLETSMDEAKVAGFVEAECASLVDQAQDATITRENGKFVVTPSVIGKAVDINATKQALDDALAAGLNQEIQVEAVIVETQPTRTTEMLSTISDALGTFSTDFSSSGASRSTNLKVGSAKINGRVLMPGETLSGYECMQPFTTQNGYATAASYENGQVVDSIGGGVCQISTTLYNASLLAELDIVQRQNHSMIVTYVKPSNDAAIAGTYKDLKISNPYDTPIYIEGGVSGRTLTFTFYGKETRPANRTLKFVSETLSRTDPGEPITKVDPSLRPGAKVKEQSSHAGLKSRLWKYVYVDGVETEKEILHTDTYSASPAIYRVGPAAPVQTAPAATAPVETAPAPTEPAPTEPVTGVHGGPGVSQLPTETAPAPGPAAGPGE